MGGCCDRLWGPPGGLKKYIPPPTSAPKGGVPTAKVSAHPGSLRGGGWEDAATGRGPPLGDQNFIYPHPRGGPLAKCLRGPGNTYIPGGELLENLMAYPPPPRRTPRDQVRASTHSGHLTGQAPPPLLTHTAQQRGEPGAGFLQGPPGIPNPGEGPWNNPPGIPHPGGGTLEYPTCDRGERPPGPPAPPGPPPTARLAAEGGTPGKICNRAPGHSKSGGVSPSKFGGTPPRYSKCPPGPSA